MVIEVAPEPQGRDVRYTCATSVLHERSSTTRNGKADPERGRPRVGVDFEAKLAGRNPNGLAVRVTAVVGVVAGHGIHIG